MTWRTGYWCALAVVAVAEVAAGQAVVRRTLDNGARLIVAEVPGIGRVGVEAFYGVGFIREPEGMTQAAHLIEHVVCMGATDGAAAGETYAKLNEAGAANAETLADFTHYDAMVPAEQLGFVLRAEAARLSSLRIDAAIVAQEAPRCYQEAVFVESTPRAPLFKFALMAAHQSWRYGPAVGSALIKGGLIEAPIDRLRLFHGVHYTPSNLTLVIVGDVNSEEAVRLVDETVGRLPRRERPPTPAIDWAGLKRDATVRWDGTAAAVIIAYEPPAREDERLAVTVLGMLRGEALHADEVIGRDARFAIGTSNVYPAGELPFFVYATLREGADGAAADRIDARAREVLLAPPTASELVQLRGYLSHLESPMIPGAALVRSQAGQVAPRLGMDESRAIGMVLGQSALMLGMADRLVGGREEALDAVLKMPAEEFGRVMAGTLRPERRVVTRLAPATP